MYACVYITDFLVQAVTRGEPLVRKRAVAVVEGTHPPYRVVAVSEEARRAGARPGMTQVQAAQFTSVEIRRRAQAAEAAAHAALLDLGWSFSPRLEDTAADTLVLDLAGLEPRWGSSGDIARQFAERAAGLGLQANVAVASNPNAAQCAARGFSGITSITWGEEAEHLGMLPIEVLAPPEEILETLHRWGVHTFRALAALPSEPLSERLGQEGVRLQTLARGTASRALVAAQPAAHFEESLELEYPLAELEPLAFILGRLLNQLCARLKARALATNEIRMQLELERQLSVASCQLSVDNNESWETEIGNGQSGQRTKDEGRRTLRLPVPTQDSRLLLRLWLLRLQSDPPPAPILKVTLVAEPVKPRVAQSELFLPLSPDPEKLELTLARITGVVGKGNAGSPEVLDTHRPHAFRVSRFFGARDPGFGVRGNRNRKLETGNSKLGTSNPEPRPLMALRVFRPPLAATVEVRNDRPVRVYSSGGIGGEVVTSSGPWRTSGDWWREDGWQQDEWDISVVNSQFSVVSRRSEFAHSIASAVALYCIYQEFATGDWFVRGSYD